MVVAAAGILTAWWRSSCAGAWPQGEECQPKSLQSTKGSRDMVDYG